MSRFELVVYSVAGTDEQGHPVVDMPQRDHDPSFNVQDQVRCDHCDHILRAAWHWQDDYDHEGCREILTRDLLEGRAARRAEGGGL
ncbi:MAG: hypothetical protein ACOC9T_00085 [Myxococcota bacterium]